MAPHDGLLAPIERWPPDRNGCERRSGHGPQLGLGTIPSTAANTAAVEIERLVPHQHFAVHPKLDREPTLITDRGGDRVEIEVEADGHPVTERRRRDHLGRIHRETERFETDSPVIERHLAGQVGPDARRPQLPGHGGCGKVVIDHHDRDPPGTDDRSQKRRAAVPGPCVDADEATERPLGRPPFDVDHIAGCATGHMRPTGIVADGRRHRPRVAERRPQGRLWPCRPNSHPPASTLIPP